RPAATARPWPSNIAYTPNYKDATARVPTPGPRGCVSGLAPGILGTRGLGQHGLGRKPPDLGLCGTLEHAAGLACSVRCLPPGAGGQPTTRPATTTSPQGHSGRRLRARSRGHVAPGVATYPRVRVPCATAAVRNKIATDHTRPGQAPAFHPPADTTHMP